MNLGHTRDRILDIAQALMVERGYSGFSFADIAERIEIRKASIHHHFPTKAALGAQVVARYRVGVREGLAALMAATASPRARLQACVDYGAQRIHDRTLSFCVCAMLGSEAEALPDEIRAEVRQHFDDLSRWLAAAMEEGARLGELRLAAPPALEGETFMATYHGAMLSARVLDSPDSYRSVMEVALRRITAGS
jgi:TetR/AcrR family transcriptional repressor of nem operon